MSTGWFIFLLVFSAIIFVKNKKPIFKSLIKIVIIFLIFFSFMNWWKSNVSLKDIKYTEGCLVSVRYGRGYIARISGLDNVVNEYHLKRKNVYFLISNNEGNCFHIEYYDFFGSRVLYSADEI